MSVDWAWCFENPKEAAAELDKLQELLRFGRSIVMEGNWQTGSIQQWVSRVNEAIGDPL